MRPVGGAIGVEAHLVCNLLGQGTASDRERDTRRVVGRAGARVRLGALHGKSVGCELGDGGVGVGEISKNGLVVCELVVDEVVNVVGVEEIGVVGGENAFQRACVKEFAIKIGVFLCGIFEIRVRRKIRRRCILPGGTPYMALDAAQRVSRRSLHQYRAHALTQ